MSMPEGLNRRHALRAALLATLLATLSLAAAPALAADAPPSEGVDVGKKSWTTELVPAEEVEAAGAQQYLQMMRQAAAKGALAGRDDPQLQRLRAIAERLVPQSAPWNPRARQWRWEVNLVYSPQLNAFCMPGGKIAFFYGILEKLQLNDDEVAMVMGHEIAHALREHARERMAKNAGTSIAVSGLSALFGLGNVGDTLLRMGGQLVTLTFSRENESEADLVGLELAARAGYDPAASISLWQKMAAAAKGAPPQWLSTHPAGKTRIEDLRRNLPKVEGLYAKAARPPQHFPVAPPLGSRR
ncbi:MAG: M48 family metallopeptidase [Paucibacter sp.]|nr:M48 family metallopeptidase [Roseateles sp.]